MGRLSRPLTKWERDKIAVREFWKKLEELERATPLGNPFPALDSCTVLIIHSERPGFLANRVGTSRLEAIFLKVMGWVYGYKGSDSQKIIDMVYCTFNALSDVLFIRKKCLEYLCKICVKNNLLPRPLQIDLPLGPADTPHCRGGFADILKRENQGRDVAVKVLRPSPNCDLRRVTRRFYREVIAWKALDHPNVMSLLGVFENRSQLKFAMVSEWMTNGNINNFVKTHREANRFSLLGDAARGLIYLHAWGMIHGDLKGDNILVDNTGNARLTDFGLVTMHLDSTTTSSREQGGSSRWMSPELFEPEMFGAKDSRRTRSSDCYALGMVVYEVLTGQVPFSRYSKYAAVAKVLRGERPERPQGPEGRWFTDDVWGILGRCWEPQPGDRPRMEDVFQHMEETSPSWTPITPPVEEGPRQPDSSSWTVSVLSIE